MVERPPLYVRPLGAKVQQCPQLKTGIGNRKLYPIVSGLLLGFWYQPMLVYVKDTPDLIVSEVRVLPALCKPLGGLLLFASSAESVGRFWFRESSQVVIKGNFHSLVGTKAVGSSGNHSDFVVETLNGAIGDFSFGSKPIQDQRLMGA